MAPLEDKETMPKGDGGEVNEAKAETVPIGRYRAVVKGLQEVMALFAVGCPTKNNNRLVVNMVADLTEDEKVDKLRDVPSSVSR